MIFKFHSRILDNRYSWENSINVSLLVKSTSVELQKAAHANSDKSGREDRIGFVENSGLIQRM